MLGCYSLWRGVHGAEDALWEGLWDLVDVDGTASGPDALGLSLGQLGDVAVHRVLFVSSAYGARFIYHIALDQHT